MTNFTKLRYPHVTVWSAKILNGSVRIWRHHAPGADIEPSVRRYLLPILGLLAIVIGLVALKASQISMLIGFGKAAQKNGPPPEVVSTTVAKEDTWEETLPSVGTVTAAKGVTISNDAPGVVSSIKFDSGAIVKQGDVLVILDNSVEQAQLASANARRELAKQNVGRTQSLVQTGSLPKAQLDNDEAAVKTSHADLGALEAQIARKVVRAPFSGKLGIRNVNLGQYLNPGTAITVLEALDNVYVDFSLPQQQLPQIALGMPVRVSASDNTEITTATIAALDPTVDSITRSIKLRASVPNANEKLRPGMFVKVAVVLPSKKTVVTVPATGVLHAPYGDSLFVVEADGAKKKVRQQFVRIDKTRGDYVAIADGIKTGEEIVTAGAFKLHNGSGVAVNNAIDLHPQLDPHPENR